MIRTTKDRSKPANPLWCPFVHVSTRPDTDNYPPDTITSRGNFITGRESPDVAEQCLCIGSGCMAWATSGKHNYLAYCRLIEKEED